MPHKFLVHARGDSVGVAVEQIYADEEVHGVILEDDSSVKVRALDDVALGHKVALLDIPDGAKVVKYGECVGKATTPIQTGRHVHVHNLKSVRW